MKKTKVPVIATMFSTITMFMSTTGMAQSWGYADTSAARPKAYYDINFTTPETLRNFLRIIDATYDTLVGKGAPPCKFEMIVALRGASAQFITFDYGKAESDGTNLSEQIRGGLASLSKKVDFIKACQISLDWMSVSADDLSDGLTVIDDALVAAIWYQQRRFIIFPIIELPGRE